MTHLQDGASRTLLSRRQVMIGAAGLSFAVMAGDSHGAASSGKALSPWVSIAGDGTITIMSAATEMGQGSMTALPLILAEEMDADWAKVRVVPAPPIESIYGNPGFDGLMYTAGSNAVSSYYQPLRIFGAQVRGILLDNAAKRLRVPVAELSTEPSVVVHAASGRRLTYAEIAAFAEVPAAAPAITPDALKTPAQFRLIGKDVMRVELPQKVNGSLKYASDVQLPGMIYGAVVRAPVAGATPEAVDDAAARAVKGVIRTVKLPYGIGVLAETPWAALEARQALLAAVTWSKTGTAWGFDSDKGTVAFAAAARDMTMRGTDWFKAGDAAAELPKAASVMDAAYVCDYAYHAQMEPLNAVASVSARGDAAEIWCGTQSQTMAQEGAAKALGIPREKVKLNDMLMGGGFGRRGPRDADFIVDAVLMAKDAGRPVKVQWTREDDVANGRFRPLSAHYLRAGLDASGKLTAWHHRIAGDRVTGSFDPKRYEETGGRDFILMLGANLADYDVPHQWVEQIYQETGVRTAPLRGIGFVANRFATETFVDEIALKHGIDPVAYRLALLKNAPRGRKVVEAVARMADWGRKREGRALGFAFLNYGGSPTAGAAEVSLDRASGQIKVHDFWCAIDCGVAVQPDNVVAQSESSIVYGLGLALSERISIKDGRVEQSNFYDYLIPRMNEVPAMHIEVVATANAPTGAGQIPTPLVAPAIGNAVAALTGVRLRHTPFTPERVKAALG